MRWSKAMLFFLFILYTDLLTITKKIYYQPYPLNMTAKSCRNTCAYDISITDDMLLCTIS